MPLLQLTLTELGKSAEQRSALLTGLTERMSALLGKRADLTVVSIAEVPAADWSCAGRVLPQAPWCASLVVHVTAGTNTPAELSSFIASAYALLRDVLNGPAAAPVYVIVNEIPAHSWGYDGRTQLDRRSTSLHVDTGTLAG